MGGVALGGVPLGSHDNCWFGAFGGLGFESGYIQESQSRTHIKGILSEFLNHRDPNQQAKPLVD